MKALIAVLLLIVFVWAGDNTTASYIRELKVDSDKSITVVPETPQWPLWRTDGNGANKACNYYQILQNTTLNSNFTPEAFKLWYATLLAAKASNLRVIFELWDTWNGVQIINGVRIVD